MELQTDHQPLLDLLTQPGFCVKEHTITQVNPAAAALLLAPGTDVRGLLLTGQEEYEAFASGCLYLRLDLGAMQPGASVIREKGTDIFLLDPVSDDAALQALALAGRCLREALSRSLSAAERLSSLSEEPEAASQLRQLNRGLYQLQRLVGNLSDAGSASLPGRMETRDIGSFLDEIFEKAQTLTEQSGVSLVWEGLSETVYTMMDSDQLERALWNILSNALKFTPRGGHIHASVKRRGRMLRLTITDSGSGIAQQVRGSLFRRYLRQPGLEDPRNGLGLGMVLIRAAAASHGGTVLVDQADGIGTRITLTLAIRQKQDTTVHSPILFADYTGGRDHALVELSDVLPNELY